MRAGVVMKELSLLIQDVVISDSANVQKIARRVGKKCSTLIREVDPNNQRAKLGVETLMVVMETSHDVRPLVYMAQQMGFELVRRPDF